MKKIENLKKLLEKGDLELKVDYFVLTPKANEYLKVPKHKRLIEFSFELIPHSNYAKEIAKEVTHEDIMELLTLNYK